MSQMRTRYWLSGSLVAGAVALGIGIGSLHTGNAGQPVRTTMLPVTHMEQRPAAVSASEATQAVASAKSLSTAFRVAADKVLPAVVAIETRAKAATESSRPSEDGAEQPNPLEGTPLEDFFRGAPWGQVPGSPSRPQQGLGSGVIIDASGLVLTNNHVVSGGGEVTVRLYDGREFKATQVWTDPKTDIAVVRIEDAKDLVAAPLGNSDLISIGDWVLALGQPFGLESTVTAGIISGKQRGIGITARESFLQTDAAINPGNSGGPLVNLDGEIIGINTAISSRSGGSDGIGFAVPINLASWVGRQLASGGVVHRAYLGVGIQPLTAEIAGQFQVNPRGGVLVTDVLSGTPAAKAGLQSGDVIVEYAGVRITSPQELQVTVERSEIGRPHELSIVRNGRPMNLTFTPEEQPGEFGAKQQRPQRGARPEGTRLEKLGVEVGTLSNEVAAQLGLEGSEGVVITDVRPGSSAAEAGLQAGMVIVQFNRLPVRSVDDLGRAVSSHAAGEAALLLIRTSEGSRFVVLKF